MFALVDYVYDTANLNYVDKSKIGVTGHSAGGLAAMRGAQYFGKLAIKNESKSKLHSVFISGMLRMGFKEKDLKKCVLILVLVMRCMMKELGKMNKKMVI